MTHGISVDVRPIRELSMSMPLPAPRAAMTGPDTCVEAAACGDVPIGTAGIALVMGHA